MVNGENATGGMGLSGAHAALLLEAGADCVTLGDHAFDQRDMLAFIESEPRIIRPLNFARAAPGRGARFFDAPGGRRVFVAQVLGQAFMKRPFDDPFSAIDAALKPATLGGTASAVIVEVHAEATSEKMALGHWCDGRASLVVGTHTHVPTADTMILASGTAYQSDAGMCGDYDSVIGMDKLEPVTRFVTGMTPRPLLPGRGRGDALRRLRRDRRRHRPGRAGGAGAARRAARRRPARPEHGAARAVRGAARVRRGLGADHAADPDRGLDRAPAARADRLAAGDHAGDAPAVLRAVGQPLPPLRCDLPLFPWSRGSARCCPATSPS